MLAGQNLTNTVISDLARNANPAEERQQEVPAQEQAEETKGTEETKQEEGKYLAALSLHRRPQWCCPAYGPLMCVSWNAHATQINSGWREGEERSQCFLLCVGRGT